MARITSVATTLAWLQAAADDHLMRHQDHLPEALDLREHAPLFARVYQSAPPNTQIGFPIVLRDGRLTFIEELAAHVRYGPFINGGRFIGTFHVHPPAPDGSSPPFFDPRDLAAALRSDNPGFIELLMAADRLYALVRANPFLYIGANHVDRNPLLLQEQHAEMVHRRGSHSPSDPNYAEHYREASLYFFRRYGLALYEGGPAELLKRTVTPERPW
jgi:hypothetical protein